MLSVRSKVGAVQTAFHAFLESLVRKLLIPALLFYSVFVAVYAVVVIALPDVAKVGGATNTTAGVAL